MQDLVTITENMAVTTTLVVAEAFDKKHKNVLQSIDRLECTDTFRRLNFQPSSYLNEQNKQQSMYNITRDGFVFLGMGFTGKKAAEFKEKFIAAFNTMEQSLREDHALIKRSSIEHSRTTAAPGGLDIRYTLDLTKICVHPTRESLMLVERLTGIDLSDINTEPLDAIGFTRWLATCCTEAKSARTRFSELYQRFSKWHQSEGQEEDEPHPSRKWLSTELQRHGYRHKNQGGMVYFFGLELRGG